MILLITFWGGPEDSPVILTPANIVTWFVIFLWKGRKRNAIPKDNLPASIYMFSHVANPKGQEFVNKLWIFRPGPSDDLFRHFSCSAGFCLASTTWTLSPVIGWSTVLHNWWLKWVSPAWAPLGHSLYFWLPGPFYLSWSSWQLLWITDSWISNLDSCV